MIRGWYAMGECPELSLYQLLTIQICATNCPKRKKALKSETL